MPRARTICVEDSVETDIAAVSSIYGYWVRNGLASFELDRPPEDEMRRRRESVLREGFPYLVARDFENCVAGFAYCK